MNNNRIMQVGILTIASIMTISLLGVSNLVNAQEQSSPSEQTVEIINELDTELTFKEKSRQDLQIVTEPPQEVKAGDTGSFKIKAGDNDKPEHLNVKYYVGQSGASEDITFGINDNGCFTNTPSDISGSHDGCDDSKIKYTFKPK
ncbi:MAG: hypothetical protein ACE5SW_13175 [Nitrososphaeraceae archaeon]